MNNFQHSVNFCELIQMMHADATHHGDAESSKSSFLSTYWDSYTKDKDAHDRPWNDAQDGESSLE